MTQRKTIVDGEKERPQNEEVITNYNILGKGNDATKDDGGNGEEK